MRHLDIGCRSKPTDLLRAAKRPSKIVINCAEEVDREFYKCKQVSGRRQAKVQGGRPRCRAVGQGASTSRPRCKAEVKKWGSLRGRRAMLNHDLGANNAH